MRRVLAAGAAGTVTVAVLAACSGGSDRSGPPSRPVNGAAEGAPASSTPPTRPGRTEAVDAQVLAWRLPGPISRAVAMRYGAGVILAGGLEPGDRSTGQVLRLDLDRGASGGPGHLAEPVHDSAGVLVGGRPTVVGGGATTELSAVQRMDGRGHWHVVGQLPGARSDLSVVGTGRGWLVLGGYDGSRSPTAVLRSRDGSRFHVIGHLPSGVRYAGVARSGPTVWLLGGEVDGRETAEVLRLDTRTGRVQAVGRMPRPLGHEAVVAVGDRLLVMGGRPSPNRVTDAVSWYDTRTGRWSSAGRLPYPVADAPWVTSGGRVFLFGGETPSFTAEVTRVTWR